MKKWIGMLAMSVAPVLSAMPGIYVGGLAGYGSLNFNPELNFSAEIFDVNAMINNHYVAKDFIAAPVLGYEWQWNRCRLGVEGQAFWTSLDIKMIDSDGSEVTIGLENEYVLLLRPGYQLFKETPLIVYANLGVTYAEMEGTASPTSVQALGFGKENVWGYKVGMGFGYEFNQHVAARLDYIFSQYQDISNTEPQNFGAPDLIPISLDLSSSLSQYLFGITYKW